VCAPCRASLFDFEAPYELRALEVALATTTNVRCLTALLCAGPSLHVSASFSADGPMSMLGQLVTMCRRITCFTTPLLWCPACCCCLLCVAYAQILDREVYELEKQAYPAIGEQVAAVV
jgi:hypothetical protein